MQALRLLRAGQWVALFGYAFFIGMMAVGYYYNLTFVQFGLFDLGTRLIGMTHRQVAIQMAFLALLTSATAILVGLLMMKRGWSSDLRVKLRLAFGVVLAQTLLTWAAPQLRSETALLVWITGASLALGVGVPATFSMTVDFIPIRDRGYAAAFITAIAYFIAATFSTSWTIEEFSRQLLGLMAAGAAGLGLLAFAPLPFVSQLAGLHARRGYGRGRFVQVDPATGGTRISRRLIVLVVLIFGIFFVDSLGFLRLAETPVYFESAWQSPEFGVRLSIGVVHVIGALIAGVLYTSLSERYLFLWIFGIFAMVHLMYTFDLRAGSGDSAVLAMPILYSLAVSLYTVVNFAIWADLSTPQNISRNTALGVAISGWMATFLSTAIALQWQERGVPVEQHLNYVDALAFVFFLAVLVLVLWPARHPRRPGSPEREKYET
jgi:MFS family permease